ncbi:hypothetical protein LTR66_002546 [Elasticomyces elasticus]|nr:hypothetical protein LTR66_002546 [Elasticomyces elasticus]
MAYTDDGVRAKLSALNETQDSIVSVAQWIMFHRRHAPRTVALWQERLQGSNASKRLNLVYLANEVVQQSKARKKDDFLIAFTPIIAEVIPLAYRSSPSDVQQKIKRVVEVWRQRMIFDPPVLDAIERGVAEIDAASSSSRSSNRPSRLGGSLFSSSSGAGVPAELQTVASAHLALTRAEAATRTAASAANDEFARMTGVNTPVPTPPVHAARLSSLLKTLATAEAAVANSIAARKTLMEGLESLLATQRAKSLEEDRQHAEIAQRKALIEIRKKEVEDAIMRGLAAPTYSEAPLEFDTEGDANGQVGTAGPNGNADGRPDVEALTPPPLSPPSIDAEIEALLPAESPVRSQDADENMETGPTTWYQSAAPIQEPMSSIPAPTHSSTPPDTYSNGHVYPPISNTPDIYTSGHESASMSASGSSLLGLNSASHMAPSHTPPSDVTTDPRLKRRKMSHKPTAEIEDEIFSNVMGAGEMEEVQGILGEGV